MLASAIQIVIHCARLSDGSRKITAISEVTGVEDDQVRCGTSSCSSEPAWAGAAGFREDSPLPGVQPFFWNG
jgi:hypothetical protein